MASTTEVQRMTQPTWLAGESLVGVRGGRAAIFRFLQSKALFEQNDLRIEGCIIGFDEYMTLVLDDAEEINIKNTRKSLV